MAFFPAFPLLLRLAATMLPVPRTPEAWTWVGSVVASIAFVAAMCYLYKLAATDHDSDPAAAVLLCASYPFAVFFSASYTESLFLLACVACYYHFLSDRPAASAVWGLIAGLTRPVGWLVAIPLAYALVTRPRHCRPPAAALAVVSPVVGLLLFCGYLMILTGHQLEWMQAQARWGRQYANLWQLAADFGVRLGQNGLWEFARLWPGDLLNAIAVTFGFACVLPIWRRYGVGDALFVAVALPLPLLFGGLTSLARFTLVLFPIFIWLGATLGPRARLVTVLLFGIGQLAAAIMFYTWRPLF